MLVRDVVDLRKFFKRGRKVDLYQINLIWDYAAAQKNEPLKKCIFNRLKLYNFKIRDRGLFYFSIHQVVLLFMS